MYVHLNGHTLQLFQNACLIKAYAISTSKRPPSNIKGSLGTPKGLHSIVERIGAGQPPGMVFKARVPTGKHFTEFSDSEQATVLITSRILRLRGLEPGFNLGGEMDTFDRCVYIHGTQHQDRIGEPLSAGCVVMRDLDVIDLYEQVRAGDMVMIGD